MLSLKKNGEFENRQIETSEGREPISNPLFPCFPIHEFPNSPLLTRQSLVQALAAQAAVAAASCAVRSQARRTRSTSAAGL